MTLPRVELDLAALDRMASEATPAPWGVPGANVDRVIAWDGNNAVVLIRDYPGDAAYYGQQNLAYSAVLGELEGSRRSAADAAFIAALRNAYPALAAVVRAAQKVAHRGVWVPNGADNFNYMSNVANVVGTDWNELKETLASLSSPAVGCATNEQVEARASADHESRATSCSACGVQMIRGKQLIVSNGHGEWCSEACFEKSRALDFKDCDNCATCKDCEHERDECETFIGYAEKECGRKLNLSGGYVERAVEAEQCRWQERIDGLVSKHHPDRDGSGCDSGDPLDLTMVELEQMVAALLERCATCKVLAERLPKTADGAIVTPGMKVWVTDTRPAEGSQTSVGARFGLAGGAFEAHITHDWEAGPVRAYNDEPMAVDRWPRDWPVSSCYSTKAAAILARSATDASGAMKEDK